MIEVANLLAEARTWPLDSVERQNLLLEAQVVALLGQRSEVTYNIGAS